MKIKISTYQLVMKWSSEIRDKLKGKNSRHIFGVEQTVLLVKHDFCPLPKRGRFDENGENDGFAFYPLKARASLLRPPKTTKTAGVTQAKAWFRKAGFVLP